MPATNRGALSKRYAAISTFHTKQLHRPKGLDPTVTSLLLAQINDLATVNLTSLKERLNYFVSSIRNIGEFAAVVITDKDYIIGASPVTCPKGLPYPWPLGRLWPVRGPIKPSMPPPDFRCLAASRGCSCPLGRPLVVPLAAGEQISGMLVAWPKKGRSRGAESEQVVAQLGQFAGLALATVGLRRQVAQARELEFYALQAQISPHFILNALNTLIMYSRVSPQRTRRLLRYLATFFRYKLVDTRQMLVPLREELRFTRAYLLLERARFGRRLKVRRNIEPAALDCLVPVLCLQPLVENAIKHGLGQKPEGGNVDIVIGLKGASLFITVADNGAGIPLEDIDQITAPGHSRGNGLGLANVHRRLQHLFGDHCGLRLASTPGKGTTVSLHLPILKASPTREESKFEAEGPDR